MAVEKFFTALVNPLHRLGFLEIILFAEDKHDDVGILLDRTRFAQIGQHRAFVLALFDRPAELGERHHRNIELLGHGLQRLGDHRDFLHPVVGARAGARPHQLQIVDDDQGQALLTHQAAHPRAQLGDGDGRRVVNVQRRPLQALAGPYQFVKIIVGKLAAADFFRRNLGLFGENPGGQLLGRHFQRKKRHHFLVQFGVVQGGSCHVESDIGRQRGFAHRRPTGQNNQIRGVQPA